MIVWWILGSKVSRGLPDVQNATLGVFFNLTSPVLRVLVPAVFFFLTHIMFFEFWRFYVFWMNFDEFHYILRVSRHLQRKHGPGTSPRDAPYPGHIEIFALACFSKARKYCFDFLSLWGSAIDQKLGFGNGVPMRHISQKSARMPVTPAWIHSRDNGRTSR